MIFSQASIVHHLKHEKANLVPVNDISQNTNSMMTIPILGERRHFDTLYTLQKVQILISGSLSKYEF